MNSGVGHPGEKFTFVKWYEFGGTGSGDSYSNPAALGTDGDVMAIPAGTLIQNVYTYIETAITGTTDYDVGDDDNADGFIDGSASLTIGTAGLYSYDAKNAGAYLRIETAGATDPGDIYVVPNAKYYAAAGKEVKVAFTGAATAGKMCVVVEGLYLGR